MENSGNNANHGIVNHQLIPSCETPSKTMLMKIWLTNKFNYAGGEGFLSGLKHQLSTMTYMHIK
jgi:hypothetical protein